MHARNRGGAATMVIVQEIMHVMGFFFGFLFSVILHRRLGVEGHVCVRGPSDNIGTFGFVVLSPLLSYSVRL